MGQASSASQTTTGFSGGVNLALAPDNSAAWIVAGLVALVVAVLYFARKH